MSLTLIQLEEQLIQEAREVKQGPASLNLRQRKEVESKVQILETQLIKESVSAKRVDPWVSVKNEDPSEPGSNEEWEVPVKGL